MINNYKQEVEDMEKILSEVDKEEISQEEAVCKLMRLTIKYKKLKLNRKKIREEEWKKMGENKRCDCFYRLVLITTRSGHKYWHCSRCGHTYTPDGKRDRIHTKFSQMDFE